MFGGGQGLLLTGGSAVDPTAVHATPSAKNQARQRGLGRVPRKRQHLAFWHESPYQRRRQQRPVHTVGTTTAKGHDISVIGQLPREGGSAVFGDKGYANEKMKHAARQAGVYWAVLDKTKPKKNLSASPRKENKKHASVRAKAEHIYRIVKCQFGCRKTRNR
ncbi:transposase [Methyloglobulus sp.]|uniref:transposase n=1 Tax=Methyloglobulus sp. TaxID=2518622 RepID=UPI003988B72A